MTAGDFARKLIGRHNVLLSSHGDRYDPITTKVYLSASTMYGVGGEALMIAAHECAHRFMHQRWPWTRRRTWRIVTPLLVWIEWKVWRQAYTLAAGNLKQGDRPAARRMQWRAFGYL